MTIGPQRETPKSVPQIEAERKQEVPVRCPTCEGLAKEYEQLRRIVSEIPARVVIDAMVRAGLGSVVNLLALTECDHEYGVEQSGGSPERRKA